MGRFPGQFLRRNELIKRSLRLDDEPKWWCREPPQLTHQAIAPQAAQQQPRRRKGWCPSQNWYLPVYPREIHDPWTTATYLLSPSFSTARHRRRYAVVIAANVFAAAGALGVGGPIIFSLTTPPRPALPLCRPRRTHVRRRGGVAGGGRRSVQAAAEMSGGWWKCGRGTRCR